MNDFFSLIFSKRFLKHILIGIFAFLLIVFIVLQSLNIYTSHGEAVAVPDVRGLQIEEADKVLAEKELRVEIIDSIFMVDKEPGIIIEQNPYAEAKIKKGRKIYVTINSKLKKKIPLPDIKDFSFRQAQTILESVGLKVGSVQYVPSEFKDLVQQVKINNRPIDAGQSITAGTSVTLVIGKGLSDEKTHLPSFRGMKLDEAKKKSHEIFINLGAVQYDEEPKNTEDAKEYVIYKQSPIAGTEVNLGKYIDVWLTKDKSKLEELEKIQVSEDYDIENFFK